MMVSKKQISCLIDAELLSRFKKTAKEKNKFVSGALEEAMEMWLKKNKQQNEK